MTPNIRLEDFGDYETRAASSEKWLAKTKLIIGERSRRICLCCGFPTLDEAYGDCYLCQFGDDNAYARLPDVQGIGANGPLSLVEYRAIFQKYLTHYSTNDREGAVEYYPDVRELRRLIVRLFLQDFSDPGGNLALVRATGYARDALEHVRLTWSKRYPDHSEECMDS